MKNFKVNQLPIIPTTVIHSIIITTTFGIPFIKSITGAKLTNLSKRVFKSSLPLLLLLLLLALLELLLLALALACMQKNKHVE